jgi:hypothetical protein
MNRQQRRAAERGREYFWRDLGIDIGVGSILRHNNQGDPEGWQHDTLLDCCARRHDQRTGRRNARLARIVQDRCRSARERAARRTRPAVRGHLRRPVGPRVGQAAISLRRMATAQCKEGAGTCQYTKCPNWLAISIDIPRHMATYFDTYPLRP